MMFADWLVTLNTPDEQDVIVVFDLTQKEVSRIPTKLLGQGGLGKS